MRNRRQISRFAAIVSLLPGVVLVPPASALSVVSPAGAATDCARPTPAIGTNLVANGDAEAGRASKDGYQVVAIPCWTTIGSETVNTYAATGSVFPATTDPGPYDRGVNYFAGGPSSSKDSAGVEQHIDLSPTYQVAIVRSVITLAQALNCTVVAEGVEPSAALDVLHGLGCDMVPGYYIARALPVPDLEHWIATSPWGLPRETAEISA